MKVLKAERSLFSVIKNSAGVGVGMGGSAAGGRKGFCTQKQYHWHRITGYEDARKAAQCAKTILSVITIQTQYIVWISAY